MTLKNIFVILNEQLAEKAYISTKKEISIFCWQRIYHFDILNEQPKKLCKIMYKIMSIIKLKNVKKLLTLKTYFVILLVRLTEVRAKINDLWKLSKTSILSS